MEKYAVDESLEKLASEQTGSSTCPKCGEVLRINTQGFKMCSECGTEPFE